MSFKKQAQENYKFTSPSVLMYVCLYERYDKLAR